MTINSQSIAAAGGGVMNANQGNKALGTPQSTKKPKITNVGNAKKK
jgi:hypothetical protein